MDRQPNPFNSKTISIDYLARTEGESGLMVKIAEGGDVQEIKLKIFEPPRFFEGFLVGRKYSEAGDIVSRICGICPISHLTTSLQAVEDAMGIMPSPQTRRLRRLMCVSQVVASHIIHLYMFVLPDYFGYPGFAEMMPEFKKETDYLLAMKEAVNNVAEKIGGRPLNPVSMVVNGFTKLPDRETMLSLAEGIRAVLPMAYETAMMMSRLPYPDLETEGEFAALRKEASGEEERGEYAFNEGRLVSSGGLNLDIHDYFAAFCEQEQGYAQAKKSFLKTGNTYMSGALARVNLKFDQLHDETKKLAQEIGFSRPDRNPFHNNLAQALEIYDGMLESIRLLSEIDPKKEVPSVDIRAGEGVAITEAPRGLLMHRYVIDRRGVIEEANLITPTSQNFANIERDLHLLAARYGQSDDHEALRLKCEQLIRAYDPCFSCSVH
ncbi:MAG: nickel-dependent hydrogenase large subunit [bacterium]|nr:nickel-dependent hydrogenase large subunit [bacterium]